MAERLGGSTGNEVMSRCSLGRLSIGIAWLRTRLELWFLCRKDVRILIRWSGGGRVRPEIWDAILLNDVGFVAKVLGTIHVR